MSEDVRYCRFCKCKTWHVNGVCEWTDGHKLECNANDPGVSTVPQVRPRDHLG